MIRDRKLKYCPRTKHCVGRWKLKKAIARCCYQKDGLCLHAPSLLRYHHANNIKVRLTDNYICVACVRPSIIKGYGNPTRYTVVETNLLRDSIAQNKIMIRDAELKNHGISIDGEKCIVKSCGLVAIKLIVMANKKTGQLNTYCFCKKHLKEYHKFRIDRDDDATSHEPRPKGATVRGMTEGDG